MSIAVSALLKPSQQLRVITLVFCLLLALSGIVIAGGWILALPIAARLAFGAFYIGLMLWTWMRFQAHHIPYQISISGTGHIRLAPRLSASPDDLNLATQLYTLLPGSTIWSGLLLLRLQSQSQPSLPRRLGAQRPRFLLIFPDSVEPDVFRRLAVACRWIAVRGVSRPQLSRNC